MGEAKRNRSAAVAALSKGVRVEASARETWYLIRHVLSGAFVAEGFDDATMLQQAFIELKILDTYQLAITGIGAEELARASSDPGDIEIYELSSPVVEFLTGKFVKGRILGDVALQIAPLIQRLKDAKSGSYKAPEGE